MIERGLYLHVPFCSGKCFYCDFFSVSMDTQSQEFYVNKVLREIRHLSETYPNSKITSIYVGGGTPTLLPMDCFYTIMNSVFKAFYVDYKEFTLEMNPAEPNILKEYKKIGVNRISLGVQSLDDSVLKSCGRRHTASQAIETLESLMDLFDNISCDLIIGLPGQDKNEFLDSLQRLSCYAKHFSLYMLKISEDTRFYELYKTSSMMFPDDEFILDLYDQAKKKLDFLGYSRYEISNFSKPGFTSLHNMNYWDQGQYFGIGPSACSFLSNKRIIIPFKDYFSSNELQYNTEESLSLQDQAFEMVMLSLRTDKGLDMEDFYNKYGASVFDMYPEAMRKNKDYFYLNDNKLHIVEDKLLVQNSILVDFM